MIVLNNERRAGALIFATALTMCALPATAQQAPQPTAGQATQSGTATTAPAAPSAGPRSLIPGSDQRPATTQQGGNGRFTAQPLGGNNRPRGGFAVNRLTAPGRSAAGLLTGNSGGLPANLWQGASAARVNAVLARMPVTFRSAAARQIARKLYLSAGAPPKGFSDAEFLTRRVSRLASLGYFTDAATLGQAGSGARKNAKTAIEIFKADLLAGRDTATCAAAVTFTDAPETFLQQLRAYCDLIAGRGAEAELVLGLLGEAPDADQDFIALAETMNSAEKVKVTYSADMSPLTIALMRRHTGASFRNAVPDVDGADAALSRAAFGLQQLTPEQKTALGLNALQYAGLDGAPMLLALKQLKKQPADYRGMLVTAMNEADGPAKAEVLASAWKQARDQAELDIAARLSKGFTSSLRPGQGYDFIAADLIRVLALNGEVGPAQQWLQVLRRQASAGDDGARAALNGMAPVALVLEGPRASPEILAAWSENLETADAPQVRARTYLLLEAMGLRVPERLWNRELASPNPNPDASDVIPSDWALWRHIVVPAGTGETGTAVAASLALIGEQGPADMEPIGLATIAGALRTMGLQNEARQLVLEALIADQR